jgi:hypothetical protein
VFSDRAHTDFVAEIADRDIQHVKRPQSVPQCFALGLEIGKIFSDGIVVDAEGICPGGFDRYDGGRYGFPVRVRRNIDGGSPSRKPSPFPGLPGRE